jgi:hypothetical protein
MSNPGNNHKINYIEFTSTDIRAKQAVLFDGFWVEF